MPQGRGAVAPLLEERQNHTIRAGWHKPVFDFVSYLAACGVACLRFITEDTESTEELRTLLAESACEI